MKYNNVITAAVLGMVAVEAAPSGVTSGVEKRGNPQYSAFTQCIRNFHPDFPKIGIPSAKEAKDCAASTKGQAKREELEQGVLIWEPEEEHVKREEEELIWEPEEKSLESRGIIDKIYTLGKDLLLDSKSSCRGSTVHDEFLFVKEIQEKMGATCHDLQSQIEASGIREDGGLGLVIDQVTKGHDKQGHQLKDKRKLTVSYLLNFYPPAKMAINEIKELASGVYDLCNDAILRLGSDNEKGGCVQDIKYYRPSKAKTYHDKAQIGGLLQMMWGGVQVADFSMDFSNDG